MLRVDATAVAHRRGSPPAVRFSLDRPQDVCGGAFHAVRRRGQDRFRDLSGLINSQVGLAEGAAELVDESGGHGSWIDIARIGSSGWMCGLRVAACRALLLTWAVGSDARRESEFVAGAVAALSASPGPTCPVCQPFQVAGGDQAPQLGTHVPDRPAAQGCDSFFASEHAGAVGSGEMGTCQRDVVRSRGEIVDIAQSALPGELAGQNQVSKVTLRPPRWIAPRRRRR